MIFSLPLSNKTRQQSTHQIGDLVFSSIPKGATSPIPSTHIFEDKYTHTMEEKMRKVISNPSSDVCVDMPGRTWEHQTTVERQKEKKKKLGHFWHSKKETWLGKHWNIRSFWCRNVHYTRLPSHPQANQLFHVHSQLAGVDWKQKSDDDVDLLPEHSSVLLSSFFSTMKGESFIVTSFDIPTRLFLLLLPRPAVMTVYVLWFFELWIDSSDEDEWVSAPDVRSLCDEKFPQLSTFLPNFSFHEEMK